ncbi:hypothetical protein [Methylomonas sp. MgM2]
MTKKTQLSKAIALALTGAATAFAGISTAQAGSTGYNAFNHDRAAPNILVGGAPSVGGAVGGNGTDGWLVTAANANGTGAAYANGGSYGDGPAAGNSAASIAFGSGAQTAWVGLNPYSAFNYAPAFGTFSNTAYPTLNWTAEIGASDSVTISRLDSNTRYGGTVLADGTTFNYADIDSAKGAWHDPINNTGWKHDTDLGLFRSTVEQDVQLSISSLLSNGQVDNTPDYGISVYASMAAGAAGTYSHHGPWHTFDNATAAAVQGSGPYEPAGTDTDGSNPYGILVTSLVLDDVLNNNAYFHALAGVTYTIMVGGYNAGDWTVTQNDYQLTIGTAPVPIPGAAWLFGGAIASLLGANRRKRVIPA